MSRPLVHLFPSIAQCVCILFVSLASLSGCDSSKPETVAEDELTNYLDDHPELAETVEDEVDAANSDE